MPTDKCCLFSCLAITGTLKYVNNKLYNDYQLWQLGSPTVTLLISGFNNIKSVSSANMFMYNVICF